MSGSRDSVYLGRRGETVAVYVREGVQVRPLRPVVVRSLSGLERGDDSDGAADLALSLLVDVLGYPAHREADLLRSNLGRLIIEAAGAFAVEVVDRLPHASWELSRDEILDWLEANLPQPALAGVQTKRGRSLLEEDALGQLEVWVESRRREREERQRLDLLVGSLAASRVPEHVLDGAAAEEAIRQETARVREELGMGPDAEQLVRYLEVEVEELSSELERLQARLGRVRTGILEQAERASELGQTELVHHLLDVASEMDIQVATAMCRPRETGVLETLPPAAGPFHRQPPAPEPPRREDRREELLARREKVGSLRAAELDELQLLAHPEPALSLDQPSPTYSGRAPERSR